MSRWRNKFVQLLKNTSYETTAFIFVNLMLPLIQVNYLEYNNVELKESAWCTIPFNEESNGPLYMMLGSTIIYFFAPIIIVTLLYSK